MRIPTATYRLQFCPDFTFADAQKIVPYLKELGISDIYASPIFKARSGSPHGYDVVDPTQLNPDLGTEANFESLVEALHQQQMGWVQDIVPNHMAYDSQNHFLMDVMEHGSQSEYFHYFDIDWEHPYEDIRGKILAPLLGDFYGRCLEAGQIQLAYEESGLTVNYYDLKLPLNIESYGLFLRQDLGQLARDLGRRHPDFIKLLGLLYMLKGIATETTGQQRRDQAQFVKELLWELYEGNSEIKAFIDRNIKTFNGQPNQAESFDLLDQLLNAQFYRLSFWKVGAEELNYRRFFTVNELISIRVEDPEVFKKTHHLISRLVKDGKIEGLRVDHVDGLYDPSRYLQRLRESMGDIYLTVEKILESDEELPTKWPIQGTSGYDFLNQVNSVFCDRNHKQAFSQIYAQLVGYVPDYKEVFCEKKRLIAGTTLVGDINNLAHLLKQIAGKYRYGRDFTFNGLRKAIQEVLVQFPIYCTYINSTTVGSRDRAYIQTAIRRSRQSLPRLLNELNLIEKILLLDEQDTLTDSERALWLHFVMRFQQFSGPLMAKGIEDTLFYVYNRFLSLNEVGGDPSQFGLSLEAFHQANQQRLADWPHSMNATSTHDTKRSEDVRSRLNVLSEIPRVWKQQVDTWRDLNRDHKTVVDDRQIPDDNDEYFLYQTLMGAFPFSGEVSAEFVSRIKDYLVKAVREAKVHTAWLRPDSEYEEGFVAFAEKLLQPGQDNEFLQTFLPFQQKIATYGRLNSLSQTLLKIASPGVPDFYQGTELWDLSLVDPDNRRPVDYDERLSFVQEIKRRCQTGMASLLDDLAASRADGRQKLFLIVQALAARQQYGRVFQKGEYIPLKVNGTHANHVIAFARRYQDTTLMAIAPRFLTGLIQPDTQPLGKIVWQDTYLDIPAELRAPWQDTLTHTKIMDTAQLPIGNILQRFPVALLVNQPTP
ncbi:malto-oligosyltrehalose synthase [Almyronema epifaneia]|uniref:Malto-oligosyltrehalose synthase n=1 Tax=Almyronema epifaneia S1 TaxID=2991925 RepID=A0ABW6IEV4_9CYAN